MLYVLYGLGIFFILLGLLYRKKGKLNWMHEYHIRNIKPTDERRFMKEIGFALIWMGLGFIVDALLAHYLSMNGMGLVMLFFVISAIGLIIHTTYRYHH